MIKLPSRKACISLSVLLFLEMAILLARLLPISVGDIGWPGPDLGLCLIFAWVIRRPDQIPVLAIALFFLLEDMLLLRPFGLWTAIVVIATEAVRAREVRWRDQAFMLEWFRVALLLAMMMIGYRFVQFLFLMPLPSMALVMIQYALTVVCYPLVVFAARWLTGLRRISSAESELQRHS